MKRALILLAIVESCQAAQIYFIGVCGDCEGNASATLTVTGFDPANPFTLTLSKFVSFSYAGTDLVPPFVIDSTNVTNVSGSLGPTYPRAYDVRIDAAPGTPSFVSFAASPGFARGSIETRGSGAAVLGLSLSVACPDQAKKPSEERKRSHDARMEEN